MHSTIRLTVLLMTALGMLGLSGCLGGMRDTSIDDSLLGDWIYLPDIDQHGPMLVIDPSAQAWQRPLRPGRLSFFDEDVRIAAGFRSQVEGAYPSRLDGTFPASNLGQLDGRLTIELVLFNNGQGFLGISGATRASQLLLAFDDRPPQVVPLIDTDGNPLTGDIVVHEMRVRLTDERGMDVLDSGILVGGEDRRAIVGAIAASYRAYQERETVIASAIPRIADDATDRAFLDQVTEHGRHHYLIARRLVALHLIGTDPDLIAAEYDRYWEWVEQNSSEYQGETASPLQAREQQTAESLRAAFPGWLAAIRAQAAATN